jgi:hypothetical protein
MHVCVQCSVIGFEIVGLGLKQMSAKSIELYNITKNYPEKSDFFCTVSHVGTSVLKEDWYQCGITYLL